MKSIIAFASVACASLALFLASGQAVSESATRARPETPEHLWSTTCGYCHGGPMRAPELRGRKLPEEVLVSFARNGAPGMPPFHPSAISDSDLRALSQWISSQPTPKGPARP